MTLKEIREKIDKIDCEMKKLFLERMECARHVAETKAESGGDVFAPKREAEIIEKRTSDTEGEIKKAYTAFLTQLMCISRKYQYGILENMQDDVITLLLSRSGIKEGKEHTVVRVMFYCEKSKSLSMFINMIALNEVEMKEMEVREDSGRRKILIALNGNIQKKNMRCLICQLGKEAPGFGILSLEK